MKPDEKLIRISFSFWKAQLALPCTLEGGAGDVYLQQVVETDVGKDSCSGGGDSSFEKAKCETGMAVRKEMPAKP